MLRASLLEKESCYTPLYPLVQTLGGKGFVRFDTNHQVTTIPVALELLNKNCMGTAISGEKRGSKSSPK